MTDYEFRAAVQAAFGEDVATDAFFRRLFDRLRALNVHVEKIRRAAPAGAGGLEIRANVPERGGEFDRSFLLTKELGLERMRDIRDRPAPEPEERERRETPPIWPVPD